ncbi:saccharopine dehydrogenase NADP-binding domain-containing protein [Terrimonas sp. NA20]|uniref:Saccharopine dehydrogenase NADP-binding domain-containing protein n=1 Tax=Terrimonas ginsenosidimutans TaxID=2908004 RepID=A0ABS9KMR0_9BACT|nr:saccharopine dehydrogenase C-terminal domain-containing protein [Terrimonas ginsenosidimutans]MCG2613608.1 saccharopine dehydrogenase NADP-binding domain-containing protein [Terrimonas ginsenosidimutans]
MKNILLFGAGKSATVLITYLLEHAIEEDWKVVVADANLALANEKINHSPHGEAVSFDIRDDAKRHEYIMGADLVISMLPPLLHNTVARDCLRSGKHLLTASYVDDEMKGMADEIKKKGLLFLCEIGLDPGIDHMSAMKIIDEIRSKGGKITSFRSHCGGLVAPESDDNPWHYKISWNPRNIILAGKAGAHYREDGQEIRLKYEELFSPDRIVTVPQHGTFSWYPNRDSLSYAPLYGLEDTVTFVRTTLRHPEFMLGWKNVIELKMTDETPAYESDGRTLQELLREHLDKHGFQQWLERLTSGFSRTNNLLENLLKLVEAETRVTDKGVEVPASFLATDAAGRLQEIEIGQVKAEAASLVSTQIHEANIVLKQLFYLGLEDKHTMVNKGFCSPADLLQLAVEKRLSLQPQDKDMIVMLHEFGYEMGGQRHSLQSSLVVKGEDSLRTAMAKTVGLPLGIAAKLILRNEISLTGLHIPTGKEIYEKVLRELEDYGVRFEERE